MLNPCVSLSLALSPSLSFPPPPPFFFMGYLHVYSLFF